MENLRWRSDRHPCIREDPDSIRGPEDHLDNGVMDLKLSNTETHPLRRVVTAVFSRSVEDFVVKSGLRSFTSF